MECRVITNMYSIHCPLCDRKNNDVPNVNISLPRL
jgi:hypothetical protein